MNNFTFPCPVCRQQILCAAGSSGANVTCPACRSVVTVPGAPTDFPSPFSTATTATAVPRTSALAIISFVCSIFLCVGCLPGIICGHLARGRIKRDPGLSGGGLALAGLIISYLSLAGSLCVALLILICMSSPTFMKGFRDGYNEARQRREAARLGHASAANDSNADASNSAVSPLWNLNLTTADFPDQPAAGKIHGQDFTVESAQIQGSGQEGIITLRQGNATNGCQVMLFLFLRPGEILDNRAFDISPAYSGLSRGPTPHVQVTWQSRAGSSTQFQTRMYSSGYAMKLQFGEADADGKLPGKIYLCLPDKAKSYVAGSFTVERNKTAAPK